MPEIMMEKVRKQTTWNRLEKIQLFTGVGVLVPGTLQRLPGVRGIVFAS